MQERHKGLWHNSNFMRLWIGIRTTILIGVLGVILAGLCLLLSPVRKIQVL